MLRLESLPLWSWALLEDLWSTGVEEVERFVKEHGRLPRETEKRSDEDAIGRWMSKRREQRRKGKLDPNRAARLEEIAGWQWKPTAPIMFFETPTNEAESMRNETGTETGFGLITFGQTLTTENPGGNRSRFGEPSTDS